MSSVVVLFLVLAALIVVGVPIGVAIGLATLAGLVTDGMPVMWFTQKLFNTFDSFPLMAVPFFLFAGHIMAPGTFSTCAGFLRGICGEALPRYPLSPVFSTARFAVPLPPLRPLSAAS